MASFYTQRIDTIMALASVRDVKPHHVEAYMRAERGTLDGLDHKQFLKALWEAAEQARADGAEMAERVAASFGLKAVL